MFCKIHSTPIIKPSIIFFIPQDFLFGDFTVTQKSNQEREKLVPLVAVEITSNLK